MAADYLVALFLAYGVVELAREAGVLAVLGVAEVRLLQKFLAKSHDLPAGQINCDLVGRYVILLKSQ
jgi:hypothetical protein